MIDSIRKELELKNKELIEASIKCRKAEEKLRDNEQKLKTILEGYPIPTFIIDQNHAVAYWNNPLQEMTGIKAQEVIGRKNHWKAFYSEKRPLIADFLIDGYTGELSKIFNGKYKKSPLIKEAYETTDFSPALGDKGKWLHYTAAILRNLKGGLVGVIVTLEDVTDRILAQEELKESEQKLKNILEGSPIPTFVIDRDHRIIYWNKALEEMSGIKTEEVLNTKQHWKAFYCEERPCLADLLVDEIIDGISRWYSGTFSKSNLIKEAYESINFFPALGNKGKWLRLTAAILRDSKNKIMGAIETLEDVTDRKLAEEALIESEKRYRELSITDGLTKLFNSRHFYHQLKSEINRFYRYQHPLSLMLLDIDDFKLYNDRYGHLEGDVVLIRLGIVMKKCLRKTDSAYRFGGEEFTIMMPETNGEEATAIAERVRQEFEDETFTPRSDETVHKTVSIGVAQLIEGEDISVFIRRADKNMYTAKEMGKNQVFYQNS